jgi:hypothetical protein
LAHRLLTSKFASESKGLLASGLVILVTVFNSVAQDAPIDAWWLHVTFVPTESAYESIPITQINSKWVKMSVLSYESLPPEARADIAWMRRGGFDFRVDNYFRRNGLTNRVICGVFEDRARHKGRFLLVLEKPSVGSWKVVLLHEELGEAGFSVLLRNARGLFWAPCMQCGEFSRLQMKGGTFKLEELP